MDNAANALQTNTLASLAHAAPPHVLRAIENASARSGVSFSYLVQQADAESSFNASAKAKTSSATGLFQFLDSTWLQMVERYGEDYGLNTDGKSRAQILAMRNDPQAASFMAAAFASENEQSLNENWGGDVGSTELYLAHFLGAGGAASFLNAKDENPLQNAANLFPGAAKANPNVFYDVKTGKARTVAQVYEHFDRKFSIDDSTPASGITGKDLVPRELSNSLIMAQTAETRENSMVQKSYGTIQGPAFTYISQNDTAAPSASGLFRARNTARPAQSVAPYYSLLAKPVDLMLLGQEAQERDKSVKSG